MEKVEQSIFVFIYGSLWLLFTPTSTHLLVVSCHLPSGKMNTHVHTVKTRQMEQVGVQSLTQGHFHMLPAGGGDGPTLHPMTGTNSTT